MLLTLQILIVCIASVYSYITKSSHASRAEKEIPESSTQAPPLSLRRHGRRPRDSRWCVSPRSSASFAFMASWPAISALFYSSTSESSNPARPSRVLRAFPATHAPVTASQSKWQGLMAASWHCHIDELTCSDFIGKGFPNRVVLVHQQGQGGHPRRSPNIWGPKS